MQTIRLLVLFISLSALFSGCSEKLEPKPNTFSQLITGTEKKAWRLVSIEIVDDGQKSGIILARNLFDPCRADDQYIFYAGEGYRFEFTNGVTKCADTEPDVILEDRWSLINADATLEFVIPFFDSHVLPYTIKSLTETVMTVELYFDKVYSAPGNINASYRFTFNSTTLK